MISSSMKTRFVHQLFHRTECCDLEKSDLHTCLENTLLAAREHASTSHSSVQVSCNILDGAAIVNMLQPGAAKTFKNMQLISSYHI